jgi:hypothetical protein
MKNGIDIVLKIISIDINLQMYKLESDHFFKVERAFFGKHPPPSKHTNSCRHLRLLILALHSHEKLNITMFHEHLTVWVDRMVEQKFFRDFLQLFLVSKYFVSTT